jgi:GTP-binding protein EngB required for normal cell division
MDKSVISSKTSRHKGPLLKIALVGDSEVGKSTIISTFIVKNDK